MAANEDAAKTSLNVAFSLVLTVGILTLLLNIMFIRELRRPRGDRFNNASASKLRYQPSASLLQVLAIVQSVLLIIGALLQIGGSSFGLAILN